VRHTPLIVQVVDCAQQLASQAGNLCQRQLLLSSFLDEFVQGLGVANSLHNQISLQVVEAQEECLELDDVFVGELAQ